MHTDLAIVKETADKCRIRIANISTKYNKESYVSMKQSMNQQNMLKKILESTADNAIIFSIHTYSMFHALTICIQFITNTTLKMAT